MLNSFCLRHSAFMKITLESVSKRFCLRYVPARCDGIVTALLFLTFSLLGCQSIKPDYSSRFDSGLFQIQENGKIGFIDRTGRLAVPPRFISAGSWCEDRLFVGELATNGNAVFTNYYFIDKQGHQIGPDRLSSPYPTDTRFFDGFASVQLSDGTWGVLNTNGNIMLRTRGLIYYPFAGGLQPWPTTNGAWGYLGLDGQWAIPPSFSRAEGFGKERPFTTVVQGGKWGIIDCQGQFVLPPEYGSISMHFYYNDQGLSAITLRDGKWEFFRIHGHETNMIPPIFDWIDPSPICDRFFIAQTNQHTGVLDKYGHWVIDPIYDKLEYSGCNETLNMRINGKWGLIKLDGTVVRAPEFDEVSMHFGDKGQRLITVRKGEYWGVVSPDGKEIVAPQFQEICNICLTPCNGITVKSEGLWGLLDFQGRWKIRPTYEALTSGGNKGVIALRNGRYVLLDTSWRPVLPGDYAMIKEPEYCCYSFSFVWVKEQPGGPLGMADEKGFIFSCRYDAITKEPQPESFWDPFVDSEGLINVCLHGKWGYAMRGDRWVIPPQFEDALGFVHGYAIVKREGYWGVTDRKGRFVIPNRYDTIEGCQDLFLVSKSGQRGYLDKKGEWIWPKAGF